MRLIDAEALREQFPPGTVESIRPIIDAAPTVCCEECGHEDMMWCCDDCWCGSNFERRQG